MITTSEVSVSLTIDNSQNLDQIVKELKELGTVEIETNQTIICVVGDFRTERQGSAPEIFRALNSITLKMISYGGSNNSLSLLIDTKDKIKALKLLSKNLFPKMISKETIRKFRDLPTPFYYYDLDVLDSTIGILKKESQSLGIKIHYAVKANPNPRILKRICSHGLGADCVSWNEIAAAIEAGIKPSDIVFAGVGKTIKK